ncbi:hypothetical protein C2W62_11795 [Candidatus Entotheonella serta]|nr:hypothetical protein C2W62_11795 [Candidatus Entotheonella serta]
MYMLLMVYALIAIGCSFLCSVAEVVLLSVTPSYVATLREQGKRAATLLEQLKDNIDRALAAILTLNTIAHTLVRPGLAPRLQPFGGVRRWVGPRLG